MRYTLLLLISLFGLFPSRMWATEKSQLPLADPFIFTEGEYYYAYGTYSDNGIVYYSSTDLVNWTYGGLALNKKDTDQTRWFWAPEVYRLGDKYYMYYSANSHLYVAVADKPTGPFVQKGSYLLQDIIGDEACIDGTLFQDDDESLWFYFVRFAKDGERIYRVQMADAVTPMKGSMVECMRVDADWERIWPQVVEGPFVIKHKRKYYMSYSANSYESKDYAVGYATASAADGKWKKYKGNPILRRWKGLVGVGHHSFFRDKEGKLRIIYHAHNSESRIHPRLSYIGTVEFKKGVMSIKDEDVLVPKVLVPAR